MLADSREQFTFLVLNVVGDARLQGFNGSNDALALGHEVNDHLHRRACDGMLNRGFIDARLIKNVRGGWVEHLFLNRHVGLEAVNQFANEWCRVVSVDELLEQVFDVSVICFERTDADFASRDVSKARESWVLEGERSAPADASPRRNRKCCGRSP